MVILSPIEALNCYILEDTFDDYFEKNWKDILDAPVDAVHNGSLVGIGISERIIPEEVEKKILASLFIMLCRNPKFSVMGVYPKMKDNLLYPVFKLIYKDCEGQGYVNVDTYEGKAYADELMTGIWYSELYKMFLKNTGGFYHSVVQLALSGCQMILFEAYDNTKRTSETPDSVPTSVLDFSPAAHADR